MAKEIYTKEHVSESKLEDLVRQYASLIEEGMAYIDHQNHTPKGRLDVLLVDSGRSLVVAELKVVEDDDMLMQALDYYDHMSSFVDTYASAYSKHKVDPEQPVRIILIAPSFSQVLLNRCKWLGVHISLYAYVCLNFPGSDDVVPVFTEQSIPALAERPKVNQIEDHLNYITDKDVRDRAEAAIKKIKDIHPSRSSVDPTQNDISLKIDGRVVAYLSPRRKYFLVGTYDDNGAWSSYPIHNDEDLEIAIKAVADHFARRT